MKNLIWKQWKESKRHFSIFSAWMILAVCYAIAYELGHQYRAVIGSFSSLAMLYTSIAAIVLAARASQGEQTDGTMAFTTSLPVSLRRLATVRIVGAVLTLAIPVLIAALILTLSLTVGLVEQAEPRSLDHFRPGSFARITQRPIGAILTSIEQVASVTAIAVFGGVELMLILGLCGCWLRNQAQVGFLGAVLALGSIVASGLLWYGEERWGIGQLLYGSIFPQSLVIHWGYADATGSYQDHELAAYRWLSLVVAIPVLTLLAKCFVIRYGLPVVRKPKQGRFRFAMPSILSRIAIPLPTRWLALVWLELRQSLPLALSGLLFAILLTVAGQLTEHGSGQDFATSLRRELPHTVFFVGALWAVVVGSSLYSSDLDHRLGSYRRTCPIPHTMWFWNKFLVGLAAVLLVMDGATMLVSWTAPRTGMTEGMSYAYVACFPMIHAFMYSLAVLGTCLFRLPLIGGLFAILSYAIATMAITSFPATMHLEPVSIYNNLLSFERIGTVDFRQHGYPIVYGGLAMSAIVCAIVSFRVAKPLQPNFFRFSRLQGTNRMSRT